MSKEDVLNALLTERYSGPVREYKTARTAPIAEILDVLRDLGDDEDSHLKVVS